jgi:hypothetical protein
MRTQRLSFVLVLALAASASSQVSPDVMTTYNQLGFALNDLWNQYSTLCWNESPRRSQIELSYYGAYNKIKYGTTLSRRNEGRSEMNGVIRQADEFYNTLLLPRENIAFRMLEISQQMDEMIRHYGINAKPIYAEKYQLIYNWARGDREWYRRQYDYMFKLAALFGEESPSPQPGNSPVTISIVKKPDACKGPFRDPSYKPIWYKTCDVSFVVTYNGPNPLDLTELWNWKWESSREQNSGRGQFFRTTLKPGEEVTQTFQCRTHDPSYQGKWQVWGRVKDTVTQQYHEWNISGHIE